MNNVEIHPKFIKYLRSAKDLAITDLVLKKIKDALSIDSDDNERIWDIIITNSSKDEYEYAYNYLDKEFNVFKLAKKDVNTRVTSNYANGSKGGVPEKISSWAKTATDVVKFVTVAAALLGISLALGGKKDSTGGAEAK